MVHCLASMVSDLLPAIFNVDGVVGASPAVNSPDDVTLVKAFSRKRGDTA
jgi:hypothetical protein